MPLGEVLENRVKQVGSSHGEPQSNFPKASTRSRAAPQKPPRVPARAHQAWLSDGGGAFTYSPVHFRPWHLVLGRGHVGRSAPKSCSATEGFWAARTESYLGKPLLRSVIPQDDARGRHAIVSLYLRSEIPREPKGVISKSI